MATDPNQIVPPAPPSPLVTLYSPTPPAPVPGASWDPQGVAAASAARLAPQPAPSSTGIDPSIPVEGRALLAQIGQGESGGNYKARFNQRDFEDFSQHPNTYGKITSGPNRGKQSNSAGRYQFLSTTWADQAKKVGATDFSPANQDKAAWNLAKETYAAKYKGRDLAADLKTPNRMTQVMAALRSQWTSLPGGIEQGANFKRFSQGYSKALQTEMARSGGTQTATAPGYTLPTRRPSPLYNDTRLSQG